MMIVVGVVLLAVGVAVNKAGWQRGQMNMWLGGLALVAFGTALTVRGLVVL